MILYKEGGSYGNFAILYFVCEGETIIDKKFYLLSTRNINNFFYLINYVNHL